ncbi:MAG: Ig-like domain-containing protein [Bacteroidetes bacterium]|nr:Ig-like domain-containing protein [Bacteroidota bacterium]
MKRFLLLLAACGTALVGQAQISITSSSLSYSQNFDALDTTSYSGSGFHGSTNLPSGWLIWEFGSSSTRNGNDYVGDYGYSNSGDTYSYGSTGSTERALGTLASGSVSPHFGAAFVNNTGSTISGFSIRYRGEQWRMGSTGRTNLDSLVFEYSINADSLGDTTSPTVWTVDTALSLYTPNMGATGGALDGNAAGNNTIRTGTINLSIPSGAKLIIRWSDPNILGSDDGLAVDSFSVQFIISSSLRPNLVSVTPANGATGVGPTAIVSMTFDKQVTAGTGNIYIVDSNLNVTDTIVVNSASVTISGNTATVAHSGFRSSSTYYITFDSTAFDTAGYHCYGLYDINAWKFYSWTESVGSFRAGALPLQVVNPASQGYFDLSCVLSRPAHLKARVIDLNGRIVATQNFHTQQGDNRFRIKTNLPAGTYLIRVDDGIDWGSVKVILQ